MDNIRRVLSYNDVLLVPRNSELEHLTDADIEYNYGEASRDFLSLPIINAPMDKVCSIELLKKLQEHNIPITIHRWFKTVEEQIEFYEKCLITCDDHIFISIGTISKWKEWIDKLIQYRKESQKRCFGFLVDIANGDTKAGIETVQYIRNQYCSDCNIMAGNVATKSGFARLQEAGANFIRVGIGGSSICETRISTGFGLPTLTSIFDCAKVKDTAYLVADGGIEYNGDICKALAAGADMVMMGKIFASTDLSSGEKYDKDFNLTENKDEYRYVNYSGMASKEAIEKLSGKRSMVSIEGTNGYIPYTGTTEEIIKNIIGNLHSSVAYYAGCRNWDEFKRKVKFVEITPQGWDESMTRVKEI